MRHQSFAVASPKMGSESLAADVTTRQGQRHLLDRYSGSKPFRDPLGNKAETMSPFLAAHVFLLSRMCDVYPRNEEHTWIQSSMSFYGLMGSKPLAWFRYLRSLSSHRKSGGWMGGKKLYWILQKPLQDFRHGVDMMIVLITCIMISMVYIYIYLKLLS